MQRKNKIEYITIVGRDIKDMEEHWRSKTRKIITHRTRVEIFVLRKDRINSG